AGDVAIQDDGVLGGMDLDVVAGGHLLESFLQQREIVLYHDVEEDGLVGEECHQGSRTDRLAVDEDLVRGYDEDVGDGRVGYRHSGERFLKVQHLRLADSYVQPDEPGLRG